MGCFSDFGWELIFFIKGTIFWRIPSPKLSNLLEAISNHLFFECIDIIEVSILPVFFLAMGVLSACELFDVLEDFSQLLQPFWNANPHFLAINSSPQFRLQP